MEFLVLLLLAGALGLIPAYVARSKGHEFGLWWIYGTLLFIVALPHAMLLKPAAGEGGGSTGKVV